MGASAGITWDTAPDSFMIARGAFLSKHPYMRSDTNAYCNRPGCSRTRSREEHNPMTDIPCTQTRALLGWCRGCLSPSPREALGSA
jgi:hypothetical protein